MAAYARIVEGFLGRDCRALWLFFVAGRTGFGVLRVFVMAFRAVDAAILVGLMGEGDGGHLGPFHLNRDRSFWRVRAIAAGEARKSINRKETSNMASEPAFMKGTSAGQQ